MKRMKMRVSDALRIIPIPNKVLLREQAKDEKIKKIVTLLDVDSDDGRIMRKKFEEMEGLVCRVEQDDEHMERARVHLPESLRNQVMHNFHTSTFGAHRNSTATLKDIIARYYWPNMSSDVVEYVKKCKECQLAKGTVPSKQGLLRGKHHNRAMRQLNLDLIGPISE